MHDTVAETLTHGWRVSGVVTQVHRDGRFTVLLRPSSVEMFRLTRLARKEAGMEAERLTAPA